MARIRLHQRYWHLCSHDAYSLVKRSRRASVCPSTHTQTHTGPATWSTSWPLRGRGHRGHRAEPLANGTSQPSTESLVATLRVPPDTGLDSTR